MIAQASCLCSLFRDCSSPGLLHILFQVCNLRSTNRCRYGCASGRHDTSDAAPDVSNMGLACLQALVNEQNFEDLQFQLFIKEIQQLNPSLREGCLFVDGLYELVCSRMPVQMGVDRSLKNSARDLLTLHSSDVLLLQRYWHKPHDADEHTAYLTMATSFVHYILTKYGPQGVSDFLQRLDYTMDDPLAEKFFFRGRNIVKLEFKWKKFVEAEVNANFRLTIPAMLRMLLARHLVPHWFQLLIVLVLMLADVGMEFMYSLAFAELIALGFAPFIELSDLFQWIGILIATLFLRFGVLLVSAAFLVTVAISVSNRLRMAISSRLGEVTPHFLTDNSASSLLTTFSQDVGIIEKFISSGLRAITIAFLLVLTCFIFSLVVVWPLAIYLAGLFILSQILTNVVNMRLSSYLFAKSLAASRLCDILKEQIDGFLVNRIYRLSGMWEGQMKEAIRSYYTQQGRKGLFFTNFLLYFQQMVPNVSIATMLFGIILLSREGYTDFTTGMSIFLFYIRVSVALTAAASVFPELQMASTALGRINAILNNKTHDIDPATSSEGGSKGGGHSGSEEEPTGGDRVPSLPIEFRGICFSYKMSAAHWNLYNVSLKINAGERVAVVGTTGSGKSTLLMLTMQLYSPSVGEVIIGDGRSLLSHGHPKISSTFQNNHMFNMSLRENIRVGNLAASNEEVEEAARKADIHNWIMTLPRGYDSPVQSGGSSLSGGQRQRIAIARMLVAKTPVCLLDEVTSALDPVTGSRVFENLMEVTKGHTVLAITHNLEQSRHFDRIVVLSHGRVKEVGSHSGLLAHKGTYWRMWNNDTAESPGKPVSIPRRRSSGVLQMGGMLSTPELTIMPLSSDKKTRSGQTYPTPSLFPLHTLLETGESMNAQTTLRGGSGTSQESSGAIVLPALTVPKTSTSASVTVTATEESSDPNPYIPRRASTPKVCGHQMVRAPKSRSEDLELTSPILNPPNVELESPLPVIRVVPDIATPELVQASQLQARSFNSAEVKSKPLLLPHDANQTLPVHTTDIQPLASQLLRYPPQSVCNTGLATQESLGARLQAVLKNNSMVSLASLLEVELGDMMLPEEGGEEEEEGRGVSDAGEGMDRDTERSVPLEPIVIVHTAGQCSDSSDNHTSM